MISRLLSRPSRRLLAGAVALTALVALLPMSAAQAGVDAFSFTRTVERSGHCRSGHAQWDLKAKHRSGGRVYVEFEVDQIPRGARWQLFVSHNGQRMAAVTRTARTTRGVQVSRLTRNLVGRDRFRAAAVNNRTGTSCFGRLRF
jgi:hypothetical protein